MSNDEHFVNSWTSISFNAKTSASILSRWVHGIGDARYILRCNNHQQRIGKAVKLCIFYLIVECLDADNHCIEIALDPVIQEQMDYYSVFGMSAS